jgi:hypothetical protein
MKFLALVFINFVVFNPVFSEFAAEGNTKFLTYTDSGSLFEVKYPKELLIPKSNGEFVWPRKI